MNGGKFLSEEGKKLMEYSIRLQLVSTPFLTPEYIFFFI